MTEYKVNLPQTNFPMKANLPEREPKMLEFWQEMQLHEKMAQLDNLNTADSNSNGRGGNSSNEQQHQQQRSPAPRPPFILHDGPPYANGDIHIGHAYNKILKDIINKVNFMSGYAAPYVPGWDCHGLPIELNIEKKLGKAGHKVDAQTFVAACREYAGAQVDSQRADFKRLGVVGDWDHPYRTIDFKYEANIVRALAKIVENGYLMRGYKPVHWCTACGSALAEAEVEYQDKSSPAIDVRFRVIEPTKLMEDADYDDCDSDIIIIDNVVVNVPIWTTTPWTLPANEAVALHPDLEYALVKCSISANGGSGGDDNVGNSDGSNDDDNDNSDDRPYHNEYLILLKDLVASTMQRYGVGESDYGIIKTFLGGALEGTMLQHPFLDKQVPIILGEHVTTDAGTGAVHTAPAHGLEDYKVAQRYNLPVNNPVGANGKFFADVPHFADQDVFAANAAVIALLKEHGALLAHTTIQHSYPHCWRHKTPLIFRATQQWFIEMDGTQAAGSLRERALTAIEQVNWLHPHGKERIKSMVEQRPDWCISRQRFWGTPIALFVHKQSGALHPETQQLMRAAATEIEQHSITFWQQLDEAATQQFLQQHSSVQLYPSQDYEKITDTLDVWFDAGVSHFCVLQQRPELRFPAHVYIEGSDQYRGWFQSSLLTAVAIDNCAPFHTVISHGFTVDGAGRKMSKSIGNVISPQKIIKASGADILRLWAASSWPYDEVTVSDEIIKGNSDAYRKLRNTARYLLANLHDFKPARNALPLCELLPLDRWALSKVVKLQEDVLMHNNQKICVKTEPLERDEDPLLRFYFSCMKIQTTAASFLSNFYFSIIKDRLYTMAENSVGRRSAQTALYYILEIFVRLIAPFISFTAEEIWQEMRKMFEGNELHGERDKNERAESVFLARFNDITSRLGIEWSEAIDIQPFDDWDTKIRLVYAAVIKEIENLRASGVIGSSLEAEVEIYCEKEISDALQKFAPQQANKNDEIRKNGNGDGENNTIDIDSGNSYSNESELRFILIASKVEIKPASARPADAVAAEIAEETATATALMKENAVSAIKSIYAPQRKIAAWLKVRRSEHPKCARCWHHRADVGKDPAHPELCARCVDNLFDTNGGGEKRHIA